MSCDVKRIYSGQDITIRLQLDADNCTDLQASDIASSSVEITKPDGSIISKSGLVDGTDIIVSLSKTESDLSGMWKFQPWNTMVNGTVIPGRTARVRFYGRGE